MAKKTLVDPSTLPTEFQSAQRAAITAWHGKIEQRRAAKRIEIEKVNKLVAKYKRQFGEDHLTAEQWKFVRRCLLSKNGCKFRFTYDGRFFEGPLHGFDVFSPSMERVSLNDGEGKPKRKIPPYMPDPADILRYEKRKRNEKELTEKQEMDRVKNDLKKYGFKLWKSRVRKTRPDNLGGWKITDEYQDGIVVAGNNFGLTWADVVEFKDEHAG